MSHVCKGREFVCTENRFGMFLHSFVGYEDDLHEDYVVNFCPFCGSKAHMSDEYLVKEKDGTWANKKLLET